VRLAEKDAEGGDGLYCLPFYDFPVWFSVPLYYTGAHIITNCRTNLHIAMARLYTTPMFRLKVVQCPEQGYRKSGIL